MEITKQNNYFNLIPFIIKAAVILMIAIALSNLIIPDFSEIKYQIKKATKDEKTRILLTSFIQNPAALYLAAEIDEKNNRVASAIMEMELAIGLLQIHNANPTLIEKYEKRLAEMRNISESPAVSQKPKIIKEPGKTRPINDKERN